MKKFMKSCAIAALVLLIVGAALAFVAGTVRGSDAIAEVVERVTGRRLHVNLMPGSRPFGIFVGDWLGDGEWVYELNDSGIYNVDREILSDVSGIVAYDSTDEITELDISLGGCSFETRVSDTGSFYVKTNGMEKIQVYEEDGVLYINSMNTHLKLSSGLQGHIILYVPENQYYDEVNINVGAGEMSFQDLNAGKVSMDIGAGRIQCDGIQAQKLKATVGMGQLELYDMDIDDLDAEVGMGELEASGTINKSADLECSMGNVDMMLTGSEKDYNYRLKAAAGNVDIGRTSYTGLGADRWVNNNAEKKLEIKCSMGNISIDFEK